MQEIEFYFTTADNKKLKKFLKVEFIFYAAILLLYLITVIITGDDFDDWGLGKSFFVWAFIFYFFSYFFQYKRQPFVKFTAENIIFRESNLKKITEYNYKDIAEIELNITKLHLKLKSGETKMLDCSFFTYANIQKLKEIVRELQSKIE